MRGSVTDSLDEVTRSQPAAGLAVGSDVGHFRIRGIVGEGGMGQVYLARDLTLGRLVALKLLRLPGSRALDRILGEARATARLNHPNIVEVYATGVHGQQPYLVLEFVDGESLRTRTRREAMSVDEVVRVARAIADALEHAHAAGIIHGDLKEANVMIGRDGRPRVVDFGLSIDLTSTTASRGGTPTHMSPEQWLLEPVGDRSDIWSLGVLIYRCLEGHHPFGSALDPDALRGAVLHPTQTLIPPRREGLPGSLVDLVQRCLSRDAAQRPSAREVRETLDRVLDQTLTHVHGDGPYRGLLPFEMHHARVFFGREAEIAELLERLRLQTTIAVIGPSGAGKSSLLHAGLAARLEARGGWTVVSVRPGPRPLEALAHGILTAASAPATTSDVAAFAHRLREAPEVAALHLAELASARRGRVLLVVDQLEELFVMVADPEERRRFLDAVILHEGATTEPVRSVAGIRDDFVSKLPRLDRVFLLRAPDPLALRATITEPLQRAGYRLETPAMLDAIERELDGGAGRLPLLQFTLRKLWDTRDEVERVLREAAYHAIGGVAGALSKHGEAVLTGLPAGELAVARALLLRLVSPEATRRIMSRVPLLEGLPQAGEVVLARLTEARLVVQRRSVAGDETLVELAHEALIVRWETLAGWIDESREERSLAAELASAAALWVRRGRRSEEAWTGDALQSARHRIRQLGLSPPGEVSEFLDAGRIADERRRRRVRWAVGAVFTVLVAIAAAALAVARELRIREALAVEQRDALAVAAANLGESELWIEPFDRSTAEDSTQPIPVTELPELSVRVHRAAPGDVWRPGAALAEDEHRMVVLSSTTGTRRVVRLEAPGTTAFVRINGRMRAGEERCAPSWIRIQALPGYRERKQGIRTVYRLPFPSCSATHAGMVEIPAGEFVYGGPGEPSPPAIGDAEPEQILSLPAFAIDRREVSNARFAPFAGLAPITGEALPNYPDTPALRDAARPDHPVTGITALTARAYCAYRGLRLPLFTEWSKAARGGLHLPGGQLNTSPRRRFPWTTRAVPKDVNLHGASLGCPATCSVTSRGGEGNVYGVQDLVGNVQEWGSGWLRADDEKLSPVFGGSYMDDASLPDVSVATANQREAKFFDFATGVRCVGGAENEE